MAEIQSPELAKQTFDAIEKRWVESAKLHFDLHKHITALSAGSIILLATFLEKLFPDAQYKIVFFVSLSAFLISIIYSLTLMQSSISFLLRGVEKTDERLNRLMRRYSHFSFAAFAVGLLAFSLFSCLNLR